MRNIDATEIIDCPTCGKHGHVLHKRFWLSTGVDFGKRALRYNDLRQCFSDDQIDAMPKNVILSIVCGSADIFESTKEGVEVATVENRPVVFDFSGHLVICMPNDNPDAIARAWWNAMYKETPEESFARR